MDHLYKKLFFILILSSISFSKEVSFEDKVYFRIDQSYFSGYELDKSIDELNFFKCLFGNANLFKSIDLNSINEIKNQSKYDEASRNKDFLKYLNLLNFGDNLRSAKINYKESTNIKEAIKRTNCTTKTKKISSFEVAKKYMKLENFLTSRFKFSEGSVEKNIDEFYDSLINQYEFEQFQ